MFSGRQNNRDKAEDERIGRILAGALGSSPVEGPCPTPEQIAALLDGTLKGVEREAVILHIAGCGRCREVFQTAAGLSGTGSSVETGRGWHIGYLMPYAAAAAVILAVVSGVMVYKGRIAPSGQDVAMNYAPAKDEKSLQEEFSDKDMPAKAKTSPEPAFRQKADSKGWDDAPHESLAMSEMPEPSSEAVPPVLGDMERKSRAYNEVPPSRSTPASPRQQTGRYDEFREGVPFSDMPAEADAGLEYDRSMDNRGMAEQTSEEQPAGLKAQPGQECAAAPEGGAGICRLVPTEGKPASEQDKSDALPEREAAIAVSGLSDELAKAETAEPPMKETEPLVVKARGTILEIDIDKGEFVFAPEGSSDKIVIEADKPVVKGFKAGDKVIAQYEKGSVNIAIRLKKWRAISAVGC